MHAVDSSIQAQYERAMDLLLEQRVLQYLEADPDPGAVAELRRLLETARSGGPRERSQAESLLQGGFGAELAFGTAGIRGEVGVGPGRFNTYTVSRAVAATLEAFRDRSTRIHGQLVVVGFDARHRSAEWADLVAELAAGKGFEVCKLPRFCPTPVVSYAVRALKAVGGFMLTASHNPRTDNGLKVFGPEGAQIVEPMDTEVMTRMASLPPPKTFPRVPCQDRRPPEELFEGYLHALDRVRVRSDLGPLRVRVAYSPLQGVGVELFERLCVRHGIDLHVVPEQRLADPDFNASPHLNPEAEPAFTRVLELADRVAADVAVVHDPDADRMAVAVQDRDGWRIMSGDICGAIMADHLLRNDSSTDARKRLLLTTWVSSRFLDVFAPTHGADTVRTLTGFKWMAKESARLQGTHRTIFSYEEAIGFAPMDVTRDKDGLAAALCFCEALAHLRASGQSPWRRWEALCERVGGFASAAISVRFGDGQRARRAAESYAAGPLAFAGPAWVRRRDHQTGVESRPDGEKRLSGVRSGLVIDDFADGSWVAARPSGTEPKLKLYFEGTSSPGPGALRRAEERRESLREELFRLREHLRGPA